MQFRTSSPADGRADVLEQDPLYGESNETAGTSVASVAELPVLPVLCRTSLDAPAARPLLDGLAAYYEREYGERIEGEMSAREAAEFAPPRGAFLLLVEGSDTVAGGGVAPLETGVAELKRMWTSPEHRRRGYARFVLGALEREADALGYHTVRLQTGARQRAAIALYRSAAYVEIAPFGRYADEPLARAFEKRLSS